jgi:pimeloyl-ACP methyl ester carboxylesterase
MGRRIWKIARIVLASAVGLVTVAISGFLAYRMYRQSQGAKILAISSPEGIDRAMFISAGGIDQWITIRGRNRANPVLLIVHGGPGAAMSPFALDTVGWERDFTVVQWDQRGAGRTYGKSGPPGPNATIDRIAQDGVEVAEYLCRELHKDKIGLIGVSWGSLLGVHMVKTRPDLFFAYIGAGQIVNFRQGHTVGYPALLAEARARHDASAIGDLEEIGPPPWDAQTKLGVLTRTAMSYELGPAYLATTAAKVLFAPVYTLADFRDWIAGAQASQIHFLGDNLSGPLMQADLPSLGADFAVPVFMFQGSRDYITPTALAREYFDSISAPRKQFAVIEGAGHTVMNTRPDEFGRLLAQWVRPLAAPAESVTRPAP